MGVKNFAMVILCLNALRRVCCGSRAALYVFKIMQVERASRCSSTSFRKARHKSLVTLYNLWPRSARIQLACLHGTVVLPGGRRSSTGGFTSGSCMSDLEPIGPSRASDGLEKGTYLSMSGMCWASDLVLQPQLPARRRCGWPRPSQTRRWHIRRRSKNSTPSAVLRILYPLATGSRHDGRPSNEHTAHGREAGSRWLSMELRHCHVNKGGALYRHLPNQMITVGALWNVWIRPHCVFDLKHARGPCSGDLERCLLRKNLYPRQAQATVGQIPPIMWASGHIYEVSSRCQCRPRLRNETWITCHQF